MKFKLRPLSALPVILFLLLLSACRREESLETGFTSAYALQDTFGTCYGSNVVGTYRAGRPVNDSNYLELTLHVNNAGRYAINTDLQNGFSFTGTGSFADTGMTTIRIPARGTPTAEGVTTLRFAHDSGYCEVLVTVVANGSVNGGGTCNASVSGTYKKDTALTAANTVSVQHNFASAGSFIVTTDTVNGYYFNKTVTVAAPGNQTILMDGFGTPAALGTDNFTIDFGDGTDCGFPITVTAGTTGGGGSTGCGTVNGTFTAGTATTAANTFTSNSHVYTATGTYTVTLTTTAPGISTSTATVTVTTAGTAPAITIPISGTPTTAGTYPVAINFGDAATCTSSLTVQNGGTVPPPGGDYFPLSANSWWSYDNNTYVNGGDTVTHRNSYQTTAGGQSYRAFVVESDVPHNIDTLYYRKDATGTTIEWFNLEKWANFSNVTLSVSRGELPIVKDALTAGQVWYSPTYAATGPTGAMQVRIELTCASNNATETVNGRTYQNVYKVEERWQMNMGFGWQYLSVSGSAWRKQWFAPGVGLIKDDLIFNSNTLLNYQVN